MSTGKTTLFYSFLIMVASLAVGMVIASRLDLTPASSAQGTIAAAPPMNSAPLSGPVDASTFRNIAKAMSPAVVNIRSTSKQRAQEMTEFFGGGGGGNDDLLERFFGGQGRQQRPQRPREQETQAAGTGFVINKTLGYILTNNHVVEGATKVEVNFLGEDNDVYHEAKIVGRDPLTDSALIQLVDKNSNLIEVKFGDSSQMQPGDWVMAIGNPFGLAHTVSVSVSPIPPEALAEFGLKQRRGALVGTVAKGKPAARAGIEPGDIILEFNGKAVKNRDELVATVVATKPGSTVPVKILRDKVEKTVSLTVDELDLDEEGTRAAEQRTSIEPDEEPSQGFGITLSALTADTARRLRAPSDVQGVLVSDVEQGSPAFRAGIVRGDIITRVNRQPVRTPQEASRALGQVASGGTAFLLVIRGGQEQFFTVRKE